MTVLALSDGAQAAALAGVATIASTSVTAWAAVHSRSRTVEAMNVRIHSMEDDVARLRRSTEGLTEAFGRWRSESDRTMVTELAAVRHDMDRVIHALDRQRGR